MTPCSSAVSDEPARIARTGLGIVLAVVDGRLEDAKLLLGGACAPHRAGAVAAAMACLRALDAALDELHDQYPEVDVDYLRHELPRRVALDLAGVTNPATGRTPL